MLSSNGPGPQSDDADGSQQYSGSGTVGSGDKARGRAEGAMMRADRMKAYLQEKYSKQKNEVDSVQATAEMEASRRALEETMLRMSLGEADKERYREVYLKAESDAQLDMQRRLKTSDFEPLAIIGRGAFGVVRLVQMRNRFSREVYAMKSMLKQAMILKNQVGHVRAERDILTESENPWIVTLHYSFQDERNLYMVMEYLPGECNISFLSFVFLPSFSFLVCILGSFEY